jgi:hypothetical protein
MKESEYNTNVEIWEKKEEQFLFLSSESEREREPMLKSGRKKKEQFCFSVSSQIGRDSERETWTARHGRSWLTGALGLQAGPVDWRGCGATLDWSLESGKNENSEREREEGGR